MVVVGHCVDHLGIYDLSLLYLGALTFLLSVAAAAAADERKIER